MDPESVRIFHIPSGVEVTTRIQDTRGISCSPCRVIGKRSVRDDARSKISTDRDSSRPARIIGVIIFRTGVNRSTDRIPICVDFCHGRVTQTRFWISVPMRVKSQRFCFFAFSTRDTPSSSSR